MRAEPEELTAERFVQKQHKHGKWLIKFIVNSFMTIVASVYSHYNIIIVKINNNANNNATEKIHEYTDQQKFCLKLLNIYKKAIIFYKLRKVIKFVQSFT